LAKHNKKKESPTKTRIMIIPHFFRVWKKELRNLIGPEILIGEIIVKI
jgi:hypothetical protein